MKNRLFALLIFCMASLSNFDLNLLRMLDALLRAHSRVRAGERLGLSQPAVSAALGRLRAALGDELFFRRGQGLEATLFALSLQGLARNAGPNRSDDTGSGRF